MKTNQTTTLPSQADLDRMLDRAKGFVFTKKGAGFLGSLMCNHDFIWDDETNDTAWCNGQTIAFNRTFFAKRVPETRITLLVHELWHTGYNHMGRIGDRDPYIWNIAGDFVINNGMDDDGFSFEGMNPLLDHQYDNMSTEQVYEALIQDAQKVPQGKYDMSGDVKPADAGEADGGNSTVISKIVQAKQSSIMSKETGVIPGEIEQIIDKFLNPVLPWNTILMKYFTELSNDDYSWKRPSRRYEHEYLPSLSGENGLDHIINFFDVSGSVTDQQLLRCCSEMSYVQEVLNPKRMTLVTFDEKIQDVYEFNQHEPFKKITIHGRGGTSLDPVQKYIKQHKPTAAVVFSDLYCHPMTENPGSPILWLILDNIHARTEFGTKIHITKEQIEGTK